MANVHATPAAKIATAEAVQEAARLLSRHYPELLGKPLPIVLERLKPARHSPDFRSCRWFGLDFDFTPAEAAIVGLLWAAWENGTPWVSQAWLLEQAGCDSKRIQDVFRRGRKAIGPMIVLSDGVACLRPPVQIMAA